LKSAGGAVTCTLVGNCKEDKANERKRMS
jgi:hypothetical protein